MDTVRINVGNPGRLAGTPFDNPRIGPTLAGFHVTQPAIRRATPMLYGNNKSNRNQCHGVSGW
jgi:hypothetical protein